MSFVIKLDMCLERYNEIWDKIKGKLNIKFYSMPVYDEKYIKAKVREFNGVIKTNFLTLFSTVRGGGGWGRWAKRPPTNFSPVTSTNVGISPQNFLTFNPNSFAILV